MERFGPIPFTSLFSLILAPGSSFLFHEGEFLFLVSDNLLKDEVVPTLEMEQKGLSKVFLKPTYWEDTYDIKIKTL